MRYTLTVVKQDGTTVAIKEVDAEVLQILASATPLQIDALATFAQWLKSQTGRMSGS